MQKKSCNLVEILKSGKLKLISKIPKNFQISRAFTIIEIVIVVVILGILFGLLTNIYLVSSKLYVYQKHLKNVEKDVLFINQNLQNLVDTTEIDYKKYSNLEDSLGFTGILYLTGEGVGYKIYLSGEQVFLDKIGYNSFPLTSSGQTAVKKLNFKIIPFKNPYDIAGYGQTAMQPFVKVFFEIQNKYYVTGSWENAVDYKFEEGFNFKYYKN